MKYGYIKFHNATQQITSKRLFDSLLDLVNWSVVRADTEYYRMEFHDIYFNFIKIPNNINVMLDKNLTIFLKLPKREL